MLHSKRKGNKTQFINMVAINAYYLPNLDNLS